MQGRMSIGIIGGNGWLGRAFAEAIVGSDLIIVSVRPEDFPAIEPMRRESFDQAVRDGLAAALRKSVSMGQAS
jgi:hypothetical protein